MRDNLYVPVLMALLLCACAAEDASALRRNGASGDDPGDGGADGSPSGGSSGTVDPKTCGGKVFADFDGKNLVADRLVANVGVDRGRFKPYDALAAEYTRVLGNTPASLTAAAETFGKADPRWYEEPLAGGVVVQTSYSIAFDGCLTYTQTPADFNVAPATATATAKCTQMARAFWSVVPTPAQIAACVDVAVTGSAADTNPRRRWAYACATVLGSAGFLTY